MRRARFLPKKLLALSLVPFIFGCADDPISPAGPEISARMTILPRVICLTAGQSIRMLAVMEDDQGRLFPLPPGGEVVWESSAPAVVQVFDDGTVLAVAKGEAAITAGCSGYCASATIRVCDDPCQGGQ